MEHRFMWTQTDRLLLQPSTSKVLLQRSDCCVSKIHLADSDCELSNLQGYSNETYCIYIVNGH